MKKLWVALVVGLVAVAGLGLRETTAARASFYSPGWNLVSGPEGTVLLWARGSIFTLRPGDTSYESLPAQTPLHAGWGYWAFYPDYESEINVTASLDPTISSIPLDAPISGAILVGNWTIGDRVDVVGADAVYTYSSKGYTAATVITPGEGALVLASSPVTLQLHPRDAASCSQSDAQSALAAIQPIVSEYEDESQLAENTPRIALSPVIPQLQTTHREFDALALPQCTKYLQSVYSAYMEFDIQSDLNFLSDELSLQIETSTFAADDLSLALREMEALRDAANDTQT